VNLLRRLVVAVRNNTLRAGLSQRLRQLVYANSHPGDYYLALRDERGRFAPRMARTLLRRLSERPTTFSIDVTSVCNLVCPTCPVGNWPKESWTGAKGVMTPELLHQLLRKALSECLISDVALFAYSEPLLHHQLPELIEIVKAYGLPCSISTNLNVLRDADALLRAGADHIVISVSGFHQASYGVTHAGGDIEVVKQHMRTLAEAKRKVASKTVVSVFFHKYRTNLDEVPLMKAYAASLGLEFYADWASFFPLEKVLTYAQPDLALADVTAGDRDIIDRLATPLSEVIARAAKKPVNSCSLQDAAIVLDVTGSVYLCCEAAMDATKNKIASYLDTPLTTVQARKREHSLCTTCMAAGLPPG
jgi:pyruvate-formate lyase-activating enzyme